MAAKNEKGSALSLLDFTLKLYKQVLDGNPNAFLSPFSVSAALLLTSLGAKGDTELEVRKTLGLENLSQNEVHKKFKKIQDALNAEPKASTTLETANRIFSRVGLAVDPNYAKDTADYYDSCLELMDFIEDGEGSRQKINKWVEQKTKDKIKDLLPNGIITADTLMVLVNAIYFKGKWLEPFKERNTRDTPFYVTKSSTKQVKMMNDKQKVRFVKDADLKCTAVELPYEDDSVSMVFIRPDEIEGLKQLEKDLTADKFESLLTSQFSQSRSYKPEVILGIPKFKLEATYALIPVLSALGIRSMFQVGKADFSKMLPKTPEAYVSVVIHKAFVEVNEEGTEAAAATAMIMTRGCAINPKPPIQFILDRPFLFAIRDKASGTVLFMGRYMQPT